MTGHEFHRTTVEPAVAHAAPGWSTVSRPASPSTRPDRPARPCTPATCTCTGPDIRSWRSGSPTPSMITPRADALTPVEVPQLAARSSRAPIHDLHHHGDRDVAEGLVDLAVNVRLSAPPDWLARSSTSTTQHLAAYPNTDAATKAIAEAHGVTGRSGAADRRRRRAFTLLARAFRPERPLIVHPQFTEPEAALIAAGHRPRAADPVAGDRLPARPRIWCRRTPIWS